MASEGSAPDPQEVQDQQFVEFLVKSIVDHPEAVKTERSVDDMGTLISLHVSAEDMGTIIGKEGRTAKALRTLLRVFGAKNNDRVNLKIIEPEGGRAYYPPPAEGAAGGEPQDVTAELMGSTDLSKHLDDVPQDELA
jgi:predicted RNA-binding protein YlqC (UPF0109 family)